MDNQTPDWLIFGDGHAEITLSRACVLAGETTSAVKMRIPTIGDQKAAGNPMADAGDFEVKLLANLTQSAPSEIDDLPLKEYGRLAKAFAQLCGNDDEDDFAPEAEDCAVTIPLRHPLKIEGGSIASLVMREPTVRDQKRHSGSKSGALADKMKLIAALTDVDGAAFDLIALYDFRRLASALDSFMD